VIIERFDAALVDDATERRLYSLARGGGPFVQRALSYDRAHTVAVFEAPAGSPIGEAEGALAPTPRQLVRIMMALALAVAPLHEVGAAHGALTGTAIVVDDHMNPTVLVSGLGPPDPEASARRDVADLLQIIARLAGCAPTPDALVMTLASSLSHPEKAAILASASLGTGGGLYTFGESLEIALLKAQRRGK
jgi:hypothetical protein